MLVPRQKIDFDNMSLQGDDVYAELKYFVYDTDNQAFVINKIFGKYDTREECQKEIDYFNSFKIVKVS